MKKLIIVISFFVVVGIVVLVVWEEKKGKQQIQQQIQQSTEQDQQNQNQQIQNGQQQVNGQMKPQNPQEKIVSNFFDWYVSRLNACVGIEPCNFDFKNGEIERGFVTKNFHKNRSGGICAQDLPDRMELSYYRTTYVNEEENATVLAYLAYSKSGYNQIEVSLVFVDNQWKIDKINCFK